MASTKTFIFVSIDGMTDPLRSVSSFALFSWFSKARSIKSELVSCEKKSKLEFASY
jgi:hypothetical protein